MNFSSENKNLEIIKENNSDEIIKNKKLNSQRNRMKGKKYQGFCKGNPCDRNAREMKESCNSKFCENSSLRHCSYFSEDTRKHIFEMFWNLPWDQKKECVVSLIECSSTQRSSVENSRRSITKFYFLKHNTNRIQVCSKMFLSILGLTENMVRLWVNYSGLHCTQMSPEKQRSMKNESNREQKQEYNEKLYFLRKWLDEIPKLESHYRRQYTIKLYFEADFKSYAQIFELYTKGCTEHIGPVSFPNFMKVLKTSNYSLFKPKNDQCDLCLSYKAKNMSKEEFDNHRKEIEKMRTEKENDIENAKSGLCLLFCIDMQAVKLMPQTNANASYYKMKLQVHNFTIYYVISHESDNYVWDETEGSLVASTFATIIIKHLRNSILKCPDMHHIIIYSDGCFYQNRNTVLSNALLSLCVEKDITIEHKYLVVGHTQMECDSTHSLIERKIKKKQINLPSQLIELIKCARKNPSPLRVYHLNHDYFLDYESIPQRYSSSRPGKKPGDPTVNMIRALGYDPNGIIYFKIDINEDYQNLPQRIKKKIVIVEPTKLLAERIKVSNKKWQHLQALKILLPADCHYFYDNIPFEK